MPETINFYPVETESQTNISSGIYETDIAEERNNQWGDALHDIVASYADVVVRCPWMGGAEVTVSVAMTSYNYPPNLTAEDEPFLISVVQELLANRVTEVQKAEEEKPEGKKDSDQAADARTEVRDEQKNFNEVYDKRISEQVSHSENAPKTTNTSPRNTIETQTSLEAKAETALAQQTLPKGEAPTTASNTDNQTGTYELAVTSSPETSKPAPVKKEAEPNSIAGLSTVMVRRPDETKPKNTNTHLSKDEEINIPDASSLIETDAAVESPELSAHLENTDAPEVTSEIAEEGIDSDEEQAEEITFDYQIQSAVLADPAEEVFPEDFWDELNRVEILPSETEAEPEPLEQNAADPQQFAEISLAVEEIEEPLIRLAEQIHATESELTQELNQILDKIVEIAAEPESGNGENSNETEVQERFEVDLEELFIELFEKAGIDYTPEIIESLARLTLRWRLADEIKSLKKEEEAGETLQDRGTHEIIKRLLAGLSFIKKLASNVGAIGKSALTLCAA